MQKRLSQVCYARTVYAAMFWSLVTATVSADPPPKDLDGTIQVPAFRFPESSFLSRETRAALKDPQRLIETLQWTTKACPPLMEAELANMAEIRQCMADAFYKTPAYKAIRSRYDVTVTPQKIGGVYTELFMPAAGVSSKNQARVLINVHGGGFTGGARTTSHVESIPIAVLGRIKVVSIDYRQAPEHTFPAAIEDVVAVYREMLRTYKPGNIGIYGCSAGGLLTAQSVAWLQKEGLPLPGAVGMFCAAGSYYGEGDSGHFLSAVGGGPLSNITEPQRHPYFRHVDPNDALAFPVRSSQILSKFPPSLLIASTRDLALSSVVYMHSRLVALGVEAELHVWEGLGHAFFYDPTLSESREVYDVTVRFFDGRLGMQGPSTSSSSTQAPASALEERLQAEVDNFVVVDKQSPPEPCRVLFVGSSSIAFWKSLEEDMAPLRVINRGFGGSHIEYVNRWFDQVVAPYSPSAIVFYAGENDIAAGKSVQSVLEDFDEFMRKKNLALGDTPVYFISLKPSKARSGQLKLQAQVNEAIGERAQAHSSLHYIDVASPMFENSRLKDVFTADDLHMNAEGYALWTRAVRAALLPNYEADARSCRTSVR